MILLMCQFVSMKVMSDNDNENGYFQNQSPGTNVNN